ncbi:hypothetical protein O1L55_32705 [Streptomyces albulus]|nr:hypothetical protein [Streptomyces noursei]
MFSQPTGAEGRGAREGLVWWWVGVLEFDGGGGPAVGRLVRSGCWR